METIAYTKSKELGYDYLKDRKEVKFKVNDNWYSHYSHIFPLYTYLNDIEFNKKSFIEACELCYDCFVSSVETKQFQISKGQFSRDEHYDYYDDISCVAYENLNVHLYRYETEDEFIKRKNKAQKAREAKKNKPKSVKLSNEFKEAKSVVLKLSKSEKEQLLKELSL